MLTWYFTIKICFNLHIILGNVCAVLWRASVLWRHTIIFKGDTISTAEYIQNCVRIPSVHWRLFSTVEDVKYCVSIPSLLWTETSSSVKDWVKEWRIVMSLGRSRVGSSNEMKEIFQFLFWWFFNWFQWLSTHSRIFLYTIMKPTSLTWNQFKLEFVYLLNPPLAVYSNLKTASLARVEFQGIIT